MAFLRRRGSTINREDFGNFQADFFVQSTQGAIRDIEADTFARDARFELERLQAQQQYKPQSEDPGIYNIPGVKGVWEGTGTVLGGVLDVLGRPAAAVAGGVLAVQEDRPIWEGWKEGFLREKDNLNFATVLENAGMDNEAGRNILGFALDVALDPLNVFMIPKVASFTGKTVNRVVVPIADIPLGAATVGDRAGDAFHPLRLPLARLFGRRPGAGAGPTEYEIRRAWRKGGASKEDLRRLDSMFESAQDLKVQNAKGHELAMSEVSRELLYHRVDDILVDRGYSRAQVHEMTDIRPDDLSAAITEANDFVEALYIGTTRAAKALEEKALAISEDALGLPIPAGYNVHQIIGRMIMTIAEMKDQKMLPSHASDFFKNFKRNNPEIEIPKSLEDELEMFGKHEEFLPDELRRYEAGELDVDYATAQGVEGLERTRTRTREGRFGPSEQTRLARAEELERELARRNRQADQGKGTPRLTDKVKKKFGLMDTPNIHEKSTTYRISRQDHDRLERAVQQRKKEKKRNQSTLEAPGHHKGKGRWDVAANATQKKALAAAKAVREKISSRQKKILALRAQGVNVWGKPTELSGLGREATLGVAEPSKGLNAWQRVLENQAKELDTPLFNRRYKAAKKEKQPTGREKTDGQARQEATDHVLDTHSVRRDSFFEATASEQNVLDQARKIIDDLLEEQHVFDQKIFDEGDAARLNVRNELDMIADGIYLAKKAAQPGPTTRGRLRALGIDDKRIDRFQANRAAKYKKMREEYNQRYGGEMDIREKWDTFISDLEQWGISELEFSGLGSIGRMLQTKWGPLAYEKENGKWVAKVWGEMAEDARMLGLVPTDSVYFPRIFPSNETVTKLERDYPQLVPNLQDRVRERTADLEDLLTKPGGVELDWRVVLQQDIGKRRQAFLGAKIISPSVLLAAGGRKVISEVQALKLKRVLNERFSQYLQGQELDQIELMYKAGDRTAADVAEEITKEKFGNVADLQEIERVTAFMDEAGSPVKITEPGSLPDPTMPGNPTPSRGPVIDQALEVRQREAEEFHRTIQERVERLIDGVEEVAPTDPTTGTVTGLTPHSRAADAATISRQAEDFQYSLTTFLDSQARATEGRFVRGNPGRNLMDPAEIDEMIRRTGATPPDELFLPEANTWILPETMATMYTKFNNPYELGGFFKAMDSFNNLWKPTVTTFPVFVSFFVRNGIGLVNLLLLSGMNPWALGKHSLKAARMIKSGTNKGDELIIQYTARGRQRVAERLGVDVSEVPSHWTPTAVRGDPAIEGAVGPSAQPPTVDAFTGEAIQNSGLDVGARGQAVVSPEDVVDQGGFLGGISARFARGTQRLRGEAPTTVARGEIIGPASPVEAFAGVQEQTGARIALKGLLSRDEVRRLTPIEQTKAAIARYDQTVRERLGFNLFGWGSTMNQTMDNMARLTHIMWRVSEGDTVAVASRSAAKWIGDYTDLGEGTKAISAVIPFFRWTRFNLPIQIEGLIRRPFIGSKLAAVTGDEAEQERIQSEGVTLPDWVLDRHHVVLGRTPEGRLQILRGLGLPIEDINKIFTRTGRDTWQNILQEASPLLRVPIEAATNQSFFTGEPIDDKDNLYGFYKRGYAWATMPGISQTLNQWLQVKQEKNPDTGRITYRSDNPVAMYTLGSFFGRFAYTGDKLWQALESREEVGLPNMVGLISGARISEVFPDRPETTTFNQALNASPYLRSLYEQYQKIALFPQFGNVDLSAKASRAIADINAYRALLEVRLGEDATWEMAARQYGELSRDNREGELLARQVRVNRWKKAGADERKRFRDAHPAFKAAMTDNLTDHERYIALDGDASPS